MDVTFLGCKEQLERGTYQTALLQVADLAKRAVTPQEKAVAARLAGLALLPGLEHRLLRQAVKDSACSPEGFLHLAGYHIARGTALLADELLAPHLEDQAWPASDRARAHGLVAVGMALRHRCQTAAKHLQRATEVLTEAGVEPPQELLYDRLMVTYFAGRWEEVEQGLLSLIERPDATPGSYQLLARCREHLGRADEALVVLQAGCERFPDHPMLWSLQGGLCWSLNRPEEALTAFRRLGGLLPFRRHMRYVERLQAIITRQVKRLAVPIIRQGRNHCFPACLAMVRAYWGENGDQRVIGAAIMDGVRGTPLYRALPFLEEEGWTTRAFRATVDGVKGLVDLGVPPILGLEFSGGAHVHLCIGYDETDQELLLQDPAHPYPSRIRYADFAEVYAQSDYWALAFVPADLAAALMAFLPEADDRLIRGAQRLWEALRDGHHDVAGEVFTELGNLGDTLGMHLTRVRSWPRLGTEEGARASVEALLAAFPNHRQIQTELAQHLSRLGQPEKAGAIIRQMVGRRPAPAWLLLAEEASRQGQPLEQIVALYRKAVLMDPMSPHPLAEWGREEQRAGNYERAEALIAAAHEMDPQATFVADLAAIQADRGEVAAALTGFRQALKQQRRYPWAWWRRGEVHWIAGQSRMAFRCLRIAMAQAPEDLLHPLRLAQLYEETEQEERAVTLLQGSPHFAGSAEMQNHLAILQLNLGRLDEALALAQAALDQFPQDPRFPPIAAEVLRRLNQAYEAKLLLESARQRLPENAYLAGRLAQLLLQQGEEQEGIAVLQEARRLAPQWTVPLDWAVEIAEERPSRMLLRYLEVEAEAQPSRRWTVAAHWLPIDSARALIHAQAALEGDGRTPEALTEYGLIALDAHHRAEAVRVLEQALRLLPQQSRACYGMARLAEEAGDAAAYARWMRQAVLTAADPREARRYADRLGDFLEQREDWEALSALLSGIEGLVPEGWRITYEGYVCERQKRYAEALASYSRAEQVDPTLAWPHYRRVMLFLESGRPAEALPEAQSAVKRFSRDVSIAWVVGRTYETLNRAGEAADAYRRALALDPSWLPVRDSLFQTWAPHGWAMLADQASRLPPGPRADLLAHWGEAYLRQEQVQSAEALFRMALDLDPQLARAAHGLARVAYHAAPVRHSQVYEVLHPLMERQAVPCWNHDLLHLYLQAAFTLDKPRRPHWRVQLLSHLQRLHAVGALATPQSIALRQYLCRLEVEVGFLRGAWFAAPHRDALVSAMLVSLYWLQAYLRPATLDSAPTKWTIPLLRRPLYGITFDLPNGPPICRGLIRLLGLVAGVGYASPLICGVAALLALLEYANRADGVPWLVLIFSAPLWLLLLLTNLRGVQPRYNQP